MKNSCVPLDNIVLANNSMLNSVYMSTPIAYAFGAAENTDSYVWFLKSFKPAIFSCSREGIEPIFVTDKCSALMNAIDQVFQENCSLRLAYESKLQ
ncbi:hypothetical protein INT47_012079 [Mucor saturninus]|uniref:MULE transposase domain-containing protein n=1 Tax=Mucor saturninus TaxID=64648 RepID=A0A8H7QLB7_9FUNG|nr:hypothetical protein INT47_012079 [Mucor saturninus]